jgi:hypothetical protein
MSGSNDSKRKSKASLPAWQPLSLHVVRERRRQRASSQAFFEANASAAKGEGQMRSVVKVRTRQQFSQCGMPANQNQKSGDQAAQLREGGSLAESLRAASIPAGKGVA